MEEVPKAAETLLPAEEPLPAEEAPAENTTVSEASPAANGVTEVSTLDALISGIANGDVKLTDNIYGVTNTITIPAGHVLDGNGKTISVFTDTGETAENFAMPADHGLCEMIAVEGTLKNTEIVAPRSAGMGTPYYEPATTISRRFMLKLAAHLNSQALNTASMACAYPEMPKSQMYGYSRLDRLPFMYTPTHR